MSSIQGINQNGIYIIYDKERGRSQQDFCNALTQGDLDKINHINHWERDEGDKRYIISMSKEYHDSLTDEMKDDMKIVIKFFRPKNYQLKKGTSHDFYVTSDANNFKDFSEAIMSIFDNFEFCGLVRSGSYKIHFPKPYSNGDSRNYCIITFDKFNNVRPVVFIRKLRSLLDNSYYGGIKFKVNWASLNVVNDIKNGKTKDKKVKAADKAAPMEIS